MNTNHDARFIALVTPRVNREKEYGVPLILEGNRREIYARYWKQDNSRWLAWRYNGFAWTWTPASPRISRALDMAIWP